MNKFLMAAAMLSLTACTAPEMSGEARQEAAGLNAFAACDFQTAETTFAMLAADHPMNPYYRLNLGASQDRLGHTEAAVESYMKAIEIGESAKIAMGIESDVCNPVEPATSIDKTVSTTVANMARENLERLLKAN